MLVIKDLCSNKELTQKEMAAVRGGLYYRRYIAKYMAMTRYRRRRRYGRWITGHILGVGPYTHNKFYRG